MIGRSLLVALTIATASGAVARAAPASAANGHRLAQAGCASCHAVERTGASPDTDAPAFRDLTAYEPGRTIDEVFAAGILVAHEGMPSFGLTEREEADLLAYVRSMQPRTVR